MSKLLLTNSEIYNSNLRTLFEKSGFPIGKYVSEDKNYFSVYKKLKVNSYNYFEKNGNYIMAAGTWFYKGKFGKEAFIELLDDSQNADVNSVRKNLVGSYGMLIKVNNICKVFVDELQTYSLFFFVDNENYIISNTTYHLQKELKRKINKYAFLEKLTRRATITNDTIYDSIYKLGGDEEIIINLTNNKVFIEKCGINHYSYVFKNKDEAVDCLMKEVNNVASIYSKYIKKSLHFLTGGVDSRLALAIAIHNGAYVEAAYWGGDDIISNGTDKDLEIAKKICNGEGIDFKYYDVSMDFSQCIDSLELESINKYGELSSIYAGNKKWFEIFENMQEVDGLNFGFLNELLKNVPEIDENNSKDYDLECFIQNTFCRSGIEKKILILDNFYEYIKQSFIKKNYLDDINHISIDTYYKIYSSTRFESNCDRNNLANIFAFSFPIMGQNNIWTLNKELKYSWRKGDFFPISLIDKFDKNLLKYPIYSHHHLVRYNFNTKQLSSSYPYRIKLYLKKRIINSFLYDVYLSKVQPIVKPRTKYNETIFNYGINLLSKSKSIGNSGINVKRPRDWREIDLETLATIVADVKVTDNACNQE